MHDDEAATIAAWQCGGDHPLHDTLRGAWDFQFSIPFHQQSLGPGGPYAQPALPAGRVAGNVRGV